MEIHLILNSIPLTLSISAGESLLKALRRLGYFSVKSGGCQRGECGACTILMDGRPVNSCMILAAQAHGHTFVTIEGLGEHPDHGWKRTLGLHILQQTFMESGAVQCGYCTPAMILAAKSLLDTCTDPTEQEVRAALSGVLCRCTGYQKPVQAVLKAAAVLRGEAIQEAVAPLQFPSSENWKHQADGILPGPDALSTVTETRFVSPITKQSDTRHFQKIGKPESKVDGLKLVQGKPAFTDDFEMRGMLTAKVLHSPIAHAWIKRIDISRARALPGVAAVLTWEHIPRVIYSTAGQSDPIPGPLDTFSLDNKVRFVGDRVAFVAAESEEIAQKALALIEVEYEPIEPVIDPEKALDPEAPVIHDEAEYVNFSNSDPGRNLAAQIRINIGDVDKGFAEADHIFEDDYESPKVQQAHIEPHVALAYWDEDDRMMIHTSTQVPFHVRRILAPLINLPVKRIRVIKPRIGGGFGGKQEILIEDVVAHLTIATGRPVRYEYTRAEEFTAARSRHPMRIHMKTGVKQDGTVTANAMYVLSDTGAYGCHGLTVTGNTGHKPMALYVGDGLYRQNPNIQFYADVVYTNTPPAGAFRGYGVPQGFWAVERHMEKISRALGIDPLKYRLKNALRAGEVQPFSRAWSEGRKARPEIVHTVGLEDCALQAKEAIGWDEKFGNPSWRQVSGSPHLRRGIGVAFGMHGTAVPYLDMGGASIKLNDDGSFNLLVGATDLGTGSDTVLAQLAAEVLGVQVEDIIVYSSDTDFTPFDKGAYASSTTYISGAAVVKAAEQAADRICQRAANMFFARGKTQPVAPGDIELRDGHAFSPDGRQISIQEIALNALHHNDQEQIMGIGSHFSPVSPPPFGAQYAEVTVDIETGSVRVDRLVMAVDAGVIINPVTASGQVEGGMTQALGYATCEEMKYDTQGRPREIDLVDYHIHRADEIPKLDTIFVETFEPSHPFGVKGLAEIPMDSVAPAVGNAVLDACGASLNSIPITPEQVWRSLHKNESKGHKS